VAVLLLGATACLSKPTSVSGDGGTIDARNDDGAAAPVTLVDEAKSMAENATTLSVSLPAHQPGRYTLILICGSEKGVMNVTGGPPWQEAAASFVSPSSFVWYAPTNGTAVTANLMGGASAPMWADLSEWSGLAQMTTIDNSTANGSADTTGKGTADLSTTTKNAAPDLLVVGMSHYGVIGAPPLPWTPFMNVATTSVHQDAWYRLVYAPGVQDVQISYVNAWDATFVAFQSGP
jgi:hypothetical protein